MRYAPAQADLVQFLQDEEKFVWAERAAAQGNRAGVVELAGMYLKGEHCEKDVAKAIALFKEAAEWKSSEAMYMYGKLAFGKRDWERYRFWVEAAFIEGGDRPNSQSLGSFAPCI